MGWVAEASLSSTEQTRGVHALEHNGRLLPPSWSELVRRHVALLLRSRAFTASCPANFCPRRRAGPRKVSKAGSSPDEVLVAIPSRLLTRPRDGRPRSAAQGGKLGACCSTQTSWQPCRRRTSGGNLRKYDLIDQLA